MTEWDIAIGREGLGRRVVFPRQVARALTEKGYNRAKLRITDGGILIVPYTSEVVAKNGAPMDTAELPDWGTP